MRNFKTLALLTTTGLLVATSVFAAPKADLDKDGQVTQAEFMSHSNARFEAADLNFDGNLNKDEHKTLRENTRKEKNARRFDRVDANADGFISKAEMEAAEQAKLEKRVEHRQIRKQRLDTDGDGSLSDAEKQAAKDTRKAKRKGKKGPKEARRIKLDANADGLVSRAEFTTHTEKLFVRMDANGDGVLTKGEGRKGRKKGRVWQKMWRNQLF